jgi:hypothetical protein
MVVVTRKKISRRNAISASDPVGTSGTSRLAIILFFLSPPGEFINHYLKILETDDHNIARKASPTSI